MEGIVKRACKDCIFIEPANDKVRKRPIGYCHRFPPTLIKEYTTPIFPAVDFEQWCGEFKDKWQVRTQKVDP